MGYWTKVILLPALITFGADRISKNWFLNLSEQPNFKLLDFYLYKNFGFMMGSMSSLPQGPRVVSMSILGCAILAAYLIFLSLFPIRSPRFHSGISFLFCGSLANIYDRINFGYVIDGIQIRTAVFSTGVFNLADAFQWVGIILIFWELIVHGEKLWPEIENRGGWVNPKFQFRFSIKFLIAGFAFTFMAAIYAFTFFRWMAGSINDDFMRLYLASFGALGASCSIAFFYFGKSLSARIAGPIFSFERFLDNLMLGKATEFKLRNADESFQFQKLADRFHEVFKDRLGMDQQPLPQGYLAPGFHAVTYNNKSIALENYKGKKIWLCLMRYAGCPICSYFLIDLNKRASEYQRKGLQIITVFDSYPKNFSEKFYSALNFPVVSDPEKTIYNKYRARRDIFTVFRPTVLWTFIKSFKYGILQGWIDGHVDQVPAHILIDENGKVFQSYYGDTITDHIPWETIEKFINSK